MEEMRILIVDDEKSARLFLHEVLRAYGRCDEAEEGDIAVDMYRDALVSGEPYDLVLMDIMMPMMDGLEALRNIRTLEQSHGDGSKRRGVKVVMVTALNDSQYVLKAYQECGASAYLQKPVTVDNLLNLLADLGIID